MAREIALDANIIVAQLDSADVFAARAQALTARLRGDSAELVLLDIVVEEALSVLCRRARERKSSPPDLVGAIDVVRDWAARGAIRWVAREAERLWSEALEVIKTSRGRLNFNDALLVVLQREGSIGDVASFDEGFESGVSADRLIV